MTIHEFLEKNKIAYDQWYRFVYDGLVYHIKWNHLGKFFVERPDFDRSDIPEKYIEENNSYVQREAILNPDRLIPLRLYSIIEPIYYYVNSCGAWPVKGYKVLNDKVAMAVGVGDRERWLDAESLNLFNLPELRVLYNFLKHTGGIKIID